MFGKCLVITPKKSKFPIEMFACPKRRFSGNCLSFNKGQAGRVLAKSLFVLFADLDVRNISCRILSFLLNFRVHLALKAYQELLQTLNAIDKSLCKKYLLNFRVHLALKAYPNLLQTLNAMDKSLCKTIY